MSGAQKNVIVLGGTGETGRRIVEHLSARYPDLCVASAARGAQDLPAGPGNRRSVRLDIGDHERALAVLGEYDLAILAMGPTHAFGAEPQALCLAAGVDCIDINDNLAVADQVLALHEEAAVRGRLVLTGMGFTPGLSGLLLAKLAGEVPAENGRYHIRACMGAAYGGGPSSPYAILSSFSKHIDVLEHGKRRTRDTPWRDGRQLCPFPGQAKAVETIPFSALETASLASGRSALAGAVTDLDARYHIQYLSQGVARFFANRRLSAGMRTWLAGRFYQSGQSMKRKKDADPDTVLWVYPDGAPERGRMVHGVLSSYDLTALMACAVADAWLAGELRDYRGAYAVDQLSADTCQRLTGHLAGRGITSKTADLPALRREGLEFGWAQAFSGSDVAGLCHYGANWYTAVPVHPKMVPLQKRYLLASEVWAALRQRCKGPALLGFIVSFLRRWRRHYQAFADLRSGAQGPLAHKWQAVTRDISMFTAGYSRARDLLGQDEALRLYGRMFLETGRMEMRWLWPDPTVFDVFAQPWRAVCDYWLAFMAGCQALGVIRYTLEDDGQQIRCAITHCAYAQMFIRMGCPELPPLVRRMEREALVYMASRSGLAVDWVTADDGTATITLRAPGRA